MKIYILITQHRHKFLIDENERQIVFQSIADGKKAVVIRDTMIPLALPPQVMPFESWYHQENDKLANSGKRICKKCLGVMDMITGCSCWKHRNAGESKDPFSLPDEIKKNLAKIAERKALSGDSNFEKDWEQAKIESEKSPFDQIEYTEASNGQLGYKDPETGETMYS